MEKLQPLAVDNLRKLAKQFYSTAYRHLFEQQDPYSPIVNAYYEWLRKLNGIINPFDAMEQNALQASIFSFLFEHNLLFQLTVLGRFDLIQILWRNGKLSEKERYLLNSMIEELIKGNHRFLAPQRGNILRQENLQSLMDLMNASSSVLKFYLYCALYEEYQRQKFKYHQEQATVHVEGIDAYIHIMHQIFDNPNISRKSKEEARVLLQEFQADQVQLARLNDNKLLYPNNTPNLESVKKYALEAQTRYQNAKRKLEIHTNKHADVKKEYNSQIIHVDQKTKQKIQNIETYFREIFKNLEARLEHFRKNVTADKSKFIAELLYTLVVEVLPHLENKQRSELDIHLDRLKTLQQELASLQDPAAIKHTFSKCSDTLKQIITISQSLPQLTPAINLIKQAQETFDGLSKHQPNEHPYTFADRVNANPANMRQSLQAMRENHQLTVVEVTADAAVSREAEVIEIPDNFQQELQRELVGLENCIDEIKIQEPDEEINAIVIKIEAIMNQLKSDNFSQIKKSEANDLLSYVEILSQAYHDEHQLQFFINNCKKLPQGFEITAQTLGIT